MVPVEVGGYVSVIAQLSQANESAIILLGASVQGRDISGRLAARLGVGVAQLTPNSHSKA